MYLKTSRYFFVVICLSSFVGACSKVAAAPVEELNIPTESAEQIVQAFYDEYLSYNGNPLINRVYQDNEYISSTLEKELDSLLDEGLRFDPVLCAQDRPNSVTAKPATYDGGQATVMVETSFNTTIEVQLSASEGVWKITAFTCQE